ncbi:hypothetical protein PR202_ga07954 [Eleusine coracana subsp. coracana]|uniref:Uncharacterized protein n=1 Tax=Eleusine coracana subsp. coracana TaxID=191504 RepID=A0AAV5BZZ1_ELECO|nr:hypothetical protein QOZ80_2AG0118230 [Eleusine coracana subsp. coracana]GJM91571.1 hypothetical protein PR202_ga07954 [Eleusine coracana subsp. coracana]
MEAASTLTRSLSLSPRARTARFPFPNNHCPFSSSSAAAPLRRARSDLDAFARSAVLLRPSPVPPILESPDDDEEDASALLLDGAGAGRNGGPGGPGGMGGGDGSGSGKCGMGEYYRRVLRVDPENALLLRNYGAYLHEVERDLAGAEACYARALLASPADADLLSRYGRVIWEARQEKDRAGGYFERAVQAAPDDCYVLGSYASFLWDAEDDDEEAAPADQQKQGTVTRESPALVPAC